jgi:hypothetical protein
MLMLIAGGVMALVVVAVIGFSSALYTSSSTSPGNAFEAGSIELRLSSAGELFEAAGLLPGDTRTATQSVTNVEHKAAVSLDVTGLAADSPLAAVLRVTVRQTVPARDDIVYAGTLADLDDITLGTFAAAEQRTYGLELAWPEDQADSSLQGASASFEFSWAAESVP